MLSAGDLKELQMLNEGGTSMDVSDYDGRTASHLAACTNQIEVFRVCISTHAECTIWLGTKLAYPSRC